MTWKADSPLRRALNHFARMAVEFDFRVFPLAPDATPISTTLGDCRMARDVLLADMEANAVPNEEHVTDTDERFAEWWSRDGRFIDPDTDDVPWFDKRKGIAAAAFHAAMAQSGNYIADDPVTPMQVTFANGRQVTIAADKHGPWLSVSREMAAA